MTSSNSLIRPPTWPSSGPGSTPQARPASGLTSMIAASSDDGRSPPERRRSPTTGLWGAVIFCCRPSRLSAGVAAFMRLTVGDEAGEVDARLGGLPRPVAGPARDHVHAGAAAELVAHRHQHAAREARREQVAEPVLPLELRRLGIAELDRQALGVVALGERDRRRDLAVEIVLLEQPGRAEVPPFGAVEEVVEARVLEAQHLLRACSPASRRRTGSRARACLGLLDQRAPDLGRDLVGGIAAEAL